MIHADELKHLSNTGDCGVGMEDIRRHRDLLSGKDYESHYYELLQKEKDGKKLMPSEMFFVRNYKRLVSGGAT